MSLVARGGAKSRWIYLVLLFLLGWGGFHNFYRGRVIRGFIEFTLGPGLALATPFVAGGMAWLVVRGVWTQDDGLVFVKVTNGLFAVGPGDTALAGMATFSPLIALDTTGANPDVPPRWGLGVSLRVNPGRRSFLACPGLACVRPLAFQNGAAGRRGGGASWNWLPANGL